jgi:hypothetical protein
MVCGDGHDNAAQGAEARICRPADDGQDATAEGERVGVVPGKDRAEVLSPVLALILVPVLALILILLAEPAPQLDPEFPRTGSRIHPKAGP